MGLQRYCDVCGLMNPTIETYGLRRQLKPPGAPYWTTEGAGSIELCLPCWEKLAKPKMRAWKKNTFAWRGKAKATP
jgi:hypothetical protein